MKFVPDDLLQAAFVQRFNQRWLGECRERNHE